MEKGFVRLNRRDMGGNVAISGQMRIGGLCTESGGQFQFEVPWERGVRNILLRREMREN
jgi:hypothetical protein